MEIKDFPKGTKLREIFIYTCERIAEPLIPLGYKYRKSRNDIIRFSLPLGLTVSNITLRGTPAMATRSLSVMINMSLPVDSTH